MLESKLYGKNDLQREVPERRPSRKDGEPYRSAFRKDYARLLHSPAFRRLQRKTQLFPGDESDFFRNRITHSFEVAQIAKSIALRLNHQLQKTSGNDYTIDTDLVEFASLAHDLGHPPFGHTGEFALDRKMANFGGFEGNAQTLRILSRIEKKRTKGAAEGDGKFLEFDDFGNDLRAGINATFRSLASIIKYDKVIPEHRTQTDPLVKGYYNSEAELVELIRKKVGGKYDGTLRTIEMQIMDVADDIAYSTYDFEDALKAGFTSPLEMLVEINENDEIRNSVAARLFQNRENRKIDIYNCSDDDKEKFVNIKYDITNTILEMFGPFLDSVFDYTYQSYMDNYDSDETKSVDLFPFLAMHAVSSAKLSKLTQDDGYNRTQMSSDIIGRRVRSINININEKYPQFSQLEIDSSTKFQMEVLKNMNYEIHVRSHRLRLVERRGSQIVSELFDIYSENTNGDLLPLDWRQRLDQMRPHTEYEKNRMRLICDYIAGMTDKYALNVFSQLTSSSPTAIFRPF
ncbi:MAG: dGTP triphosphohydrolase [Pseudomonadota bacterium]